MNSRFGKTWAEWDKRVDNGEAPASILRDAKDEDLVEVLGGESPSDRRYVRDIIATELLNRLRSRSKHPAAAESAANSALRARDAAEEGQEAIHRAERLLKASGQVELGSAVSASAYASLDASQEAFKAARDHAESLQQTLAQSRAGGQLAEDAARAAETGTDITRDLGAKMESIGRAKEGRAATAAARAIRTTADQAVTDADASHDEMRER